MPFTPTLSESARSLEHLREHLRGLIRFARTFAAICRIAVNIHVDIHSNNGDVFFIFRVFQVVAHEHNPHSNQAALGGGKWCCITT